MPHLGPDHVQLTKVNWRLKVNWKNFQEFFWKNFPIDFIVVNHVLWVNSIENVKSQLQTSKVNCKLQISYTILRKNSYFCCWSAGKGREIWTMNLWSHTSLRYWIFHQRAMFIKVHLDFVQGLQVQLKGLVPKTKATRMFSNIVIWEKSKCVQQS